MNQHIVPDSISSPLRDLKRCENEFYRGSDTCVIANYRSQINLIISIIDWIALNPIKSQYSSALYLTTIHPLIVNSCSENGRRNLIFSVPKNFHYGESVGERKVRLLHSESSIVTPPASRMENQTW